MIASLITAVIHISIAAVSLQDLRDAFFNALTEEGKKTFLEKSQSADINNSTQLAYKGVAMAMYADVVFSPMEKLAYFNNGKKLLESAISKNGSDYEALFLRFSVQAEVPAILNYNANLTGDSNAIIVALKSKKVDPADAFWQKVIDYMVKCDELNALQKIELQRLKK